MNCRRICSPRNAAGSGGNGAGPGPGGAGTRTQKGRAGRRQVRELEARIAALEERKEKLEALLAREDLYRDAEKSAFYLTEYRDLTHELETAVEEWAEAADALGEE